MARNIRLNNAGNLKAPDEATGRKYWGKYGFTGLDEDGFAMFDTAAGGRAALEQQIRIDQSRDQTQEEFINKYVGASADPQGTTNAQINIPQLTGAPSDTTLSEIDKDVLFNAIVQNEGGKDSVDYFAKPKLDFDALDKTQGRAAAQDTAKEFDSFLPTAPAPTIESETIGAAKPTATGLTGDQLTQRILDQDAALAEEEASGPPIPSGASSFDASAVDERLRTLNRLTGADIPIIRDRTATGLTDEQLREQMQKQQLPIAQETPSAFIKPAPPESPMAGAFDEFESPYPTNTIAPTPRAEKKVTNLPQPEMAKVDVPKDSEMPDVGLLSRLGNAAKANPDIALAGMEGIGSLLANIGAGRAQKAADQTQRQGMARSNLVSALTGGKVRPGVAEEAPQMGLLGRVGQAVGTAGKLGREVSQERFERGFKEEEMGRKYDVKEAELDRKIAADGLKLSELARKEKLDEARIENWIAQNTLGMDRNDVARYRAKIYAKLGEGRLALDVDKFAQEKIEFKELMGLKGDKLALAQKIQSFDEEDTNRMYALSLDEFALDERRVAALEAKGLVDQQRAQDYGRSVSIAEHAAGADRRKALQTTIRNLDKAELAEMMDPKQGALKVVNGLNSAYKDYETGANQANMNAVFQMYQRLFDPATVREGDLSIQREGQGLILSIVATLERNTTGGFVLATSVIDNMEKIAQRYRASMQASAENKLDNYLNQIYLGNSPTENDIAEAEQIRNYYNAVWNFDPTKTQVRTGATTTGENAGDSFVEKAFPQ